MNCKCNFFRQSPINLVNVKSTLNDNMLKLKLTSEKFILKFNSTKIPIDIAHQVFVEYIAENLQGDSINGYSKLFFDNIEFKLKQFHFHHPSEHTIDKKIYHMEVHLVFQHKNSFVVLGFFIQKNLDKSNPILNKIFNLVNQLESKPQIELNLNNLIPKNTKKFVYQGSLTTPPYTESVQWVVFESPVLISSKDYENYLNIFPRPNARNTCSNSKDVYFLN